MVPAIILAPHPKRGAGKDWGDGLRDYYYLSTIKISHMIILPSFTVGSSLNLFFFESSKNAPTLFSIFKDAIMYKNCEEVLVRTIKLAYQ